MFASRPKSIKATPKKGPGFLRLFGLRSFVDKCYRDPFRWGVVKCLAFFAMGVCTARALAGMDLVPSEQAPDVTQAAY